MDVLLGIGMQMVMPLLGRPPDDALLRGRLGHECENELKRPAGRIGAVREIAMVSGHDGKDAQPIERNADGQRLPGDARPDRREAAEMDEYEGNSRRIDDVVMQFVGIGVRGHRSAIRLGRWLVSYMERAAGFAKRSPGSSLRKSSYRTRSPQRL